MKKDLSVSTQNNKKYDIVLSHLGLVKSIARNLCNGYGCLDIYEDTVSEGYKALIDAVLNFDSEKGVTLACYAYPWIKKAILKYIKKEKRHGIQVSRTFIVLVKKVKEAVETLSSQKQSFSFQTIANKVNTSLEDVEKAIHFLALSFSDIDAINPLQEENLSLKKQSYNDQTFLYQDFGLLEEKVQQLRPEWCIVIRKHYIESKTFNQIAIEMNQKHSTVKVWHKRAIETLRCI